MRRAPSTKASTFPHNLRAPVAASRPKQVKRLCLYGVPSTYIPPSDVPAFPVRAHLRTASGQQTRHSRVNSAAPPSRQASVQPPSVQPRATIKQEQDFHEVHTVILGSLQAALTTLERLEQRMQAVEATLTAFDGRWADQMEDRLCRVLEDRLDVNVVVNRLINGVVPAVEAAVQKATVAPTRLPQPSPMAGGSSPFTRRGMLSRPQQFNSRSLLAATPFNQSIGFTLTDSLGVSDNGTDWGNSSFLYRTPQTSHIMPQPQLSTVLDEPEEQSQATKSTSPPKQLIRLDMDQLTSSQPPEPQDSHETMCSTNDGGYSTDEFKQYRKDTDRMSYHQRESDRTAYATDSEKPVYETYRKAATHRKEENEVYRQEDHFSYRDYDFHPPPVSSCEETEEEDLIQPRKSGRCGV